MQIVVQSPPDPRLLRGIEARLGAFNQEKAPALTLEEVFVVAQKNNRVLGGALGIDEGGWMFLHSMWVEPELRGKGIGSMLMARLEAEAVKRGCHSLHTDTFTFQALPFYQGLGYVVFGELEGYHGDQTRYYLRKRLVP